MAAAAAASAVVVVGRPRADGARSRCPGGGRASAVTGCHHRRRRAWSRRLAPARPGGDRPPPPSSACSRRCPSWLRVSLGPRRPLPPTSVRDGSVPSRSRRSDVLTEWSEIDSGQMATARATEKRFACPVDFFSLFRFFFLFLFTSSLRRGLFEADSPRKWQNNKNDIFSGPNETTF